MKRFEEWYKAINEELGAEPTAAEVSTESPRDAMIQDVDTIMTSLETLAAELTEELQNEDLVEINEDQSNIDGLTGIATSALAAGGIAAGGAYMAVKKLIDYSVRGPKAAKAQAKVDAIKLQAAKLELALSTASDKGVSAEKKEAITKRIEATKEQADQLQDALDQKFASASSTVQKFIDNQKLKTRMELTKIHLSDASDEEKAELTDKLKKLNAKYDEDKLALQELKPTEDEQKKAKKEAAELEKKKKEKEAAAKKAEAEKGGESEETASKEPAPKSEPTNKEEEPTSTTTKAEPADTSKQDAVAAKEADIKAYNDNIETEKGRIQDLAKQLKDIETEKAKSTNPESYDEKIAKLKKGIEDSREDIQQMKKDEEAAKKELSKMSAKESLMYRSLQLDNEILAEEIATKQEWQLAEGTALYNKYNTIIRKAEMDSKLNESISLNIKDRFSKLI
jgi:hypothetical protein